MQMVAFAVAPVVATWKAGFAVDPVAQHLQSQKKELAIQTLLMRTEMKRQTAAQFGANLPIATSG
jgi:hypothetical protein